MLTLTEILKILQRIKRKLDSDSRSASNYADASPLSPTTPIEEVEIPDYESMASRFSSTKDSLVVFFSSAQQKDISHIECYLAIINNHMCDIDLAKRVLIYKKFDPSLTRAVFEKFRDDSSSEFNELLLEILKQSPALDDDVFFLALSRYKEKPELVDELLKNGNLNLSHCIRMSLIEDLSDEHRKQIQEKQNIVSNEPQINHGSSVSIRRSPSVSSRSRSFSRRGQSPIRSMSPVPRVLTQESVAGSQGWYFKEFSEFNQIIMFEEEQVLSLFDTYPTIPVTHVSIADYRQILMYLAIIYKIEHEQIGNLISTDLLMALKYCDALNSHEGINPFNSSTILAISSCDDVTLLSTIPDSYFQGPNSFEGNDLEQDHFLAIQYWIALISNPLCEDELTAKIINKVFDASCSDSRAWGVLLEQATQTEYLCDKICRVISFDAVKMYPEHPIYNFDPDTLIPKFIVTNFRLLAHVLVTSKQQDQYDAKLLEIVTNYIESMVTSYSIDEDSIRTMVDILARSKMTSQPFIKAVLKKSERSQSYVDSDMLLHLVREDIDQDSLELVCLSGLLDSSLVFEVLNKVEQGIISFENMVRWVLHSHNMDVEVVTKLIDYANDHPAIVSSLCGDEFIQIAFEYVKDSSEVACKILKFYSEQTQSSLALRRVASIIHQYEFSLDIELRMIENVACDAEILATLATLTRFSASLYESLMKIGRITPLIRMSFLNNENLISDELCIKLIDGIEVQEISSILALMNRRSIEINQRLIDHLTLIINEKHTLDEDIFSILRFWDGSSEFHQMSGEYLIKYIDLLFTINKKTGYSFEAKISEIIEKLTIQISKSEELFEVLNHTVPSDKDAEFGNLRQAIIHGIIDNATGEQREEIITKTLRRTTNREVLLSIARLQLSSDNVSEILAKTEDEEIQLKLMQQPEASNSLSVLAKSSSVSVLIKLFEEHKTIEVLAALIENREAGFLLAKIADSEIVREKVIANLLLARAKDLPDLGTRLYQNQNVDDETREKLVSRNLVSKACRLAYVASHLSDYCSVRNSLTPEDATALLMSNKFNDEELAKLLVEIGNNQGLLLLVISNQKVSVANMEKIIANATDPDLHQKIFDVLHDFDDTVLRRRLFEKLVSQPSCLLSLCIKCLQACGYDERLCLISVNLIGIGTVSEGSEEQKFLEELAQHSNSSTVHLMLVAHAKYDYAFAMVLMLLDNKYLEHTVLVQILKLGINPDQFIDRIFSIVPFNEELALAVIDNPNVSIRKLIQSINLLSISNVNVLDKLMRLNHAEIDRSIIDLLKSKSSTLEIDTVDQLNVLIEVIFQIIHRTIDVDKTLLFKIISKFKFNLSCFTDQMYESAMRHFVSISDDKSSIVSTYLSSMNSTGRTPQISDECIKFLIDSSDQQIIELLVKAIYTLASKLEILITNEIFKENLMNHMYTLDANHVSIYAEKFFPFILDKDFSHEMYLLLLKNDLIIEDDSATKLGVQLIDSLFEIHNLKTIAAMLEAKQAVKYILEQLSQASEINTDIIPLLLQQNLSSELLSKIIAAVISHPQLRVDIDNWCNIVNNPGITDDHLIKIIDHLASIELLDDDRVWNNIIAKVTNHDLFLVMLSKIKLSITSLEAILRYNPDVSIILRILSSFDCSKHADLVNLTLKIRSEQEVIDILLQKDLLSDQQLEAVEKSKIIDALSRLQLSETMISKILRLHGENIEVLDSILTQQALPDDILLVIASSTNSHLLLKVQEKSHSVAICTALIDNQNFPLESCMQILRRSRYNEEICGHILHRLLSNPEEEYLCEIISKTIDREKLKLILQNCLLTEKIILAIIENSISVELMNFICTNSIAAEEVVFDVLLSKCEKNHALVSLLAENSHLTDEQLLRLYQIENLSLGLQDIVLQKIKNINLRISLSNELSCFTLDQLLGYLGSEQCTLQTIDMFIGTYVNSPDMMKQVLQQHNISVQQIIRIIQSTNNLAVLEYISETYSDNGEIVAALIGNKLLPTDVQFQLITQHNHHESYVVKLMPLISVEQDLEKFKVIAGLPIATNPDIFQCLVGVATDSTDVVDILLANKSITDQQKVSLSQQVHLSPKQKLRAMQESPRSIIFSDEDLADRKFLGELLSSQVDAVQLEHIIRLHSNDEQLMVRVLEQGALVPDHASLMIDSATPDFVRKIALKFPNSISVMISVISNSNSPIDLCISLIRRSNYDAKLVCTILERDDVGEYLPEIISKVHDLSVISKIMDKYGINKEIAMAILSNPVAQAKQHIIAATSVATDVFEELTKNPNREVLIALAQNKHLTDEQRCELFRIDGVSIAIQREIITRFTDEMLRLENSVLDLHQVSIEAVKQYLQSYTCDADKLEEIVKEFAENEEILRIIIETQSLGLTLVARYASSIDILKLVINKSRLNDQTFLEIIKLISAKPIVVYPDIMREVISFIRATSEYSILRILLENPMVDGSMLCELLDITGLPFKNEIIYKIPNEELRVKMQAIHLNCKDFVVAYLSHAQASISELNMFIMKYGEHQDIQLQILDQNNFLQLNLDSILATITTDSVLLAFWIKVKDTELVDLRSVLVHPSASPNIRIEILKKNSKLVDDFLATYQDRDDLIYILSNFSLSIHNIHLIYNICRRNNILTKDVLLQIASHRAAADSVTIMLLLSHCVDHTLLDICLTRLAEIEDVESCFNELIALLEHSSITTELQQRAFTLFSDKLMSNPAMYLKFISAIKENVDLHQRIFHVMAELDYSLICNMEQVYEVMLYMTSVSADEVILLSVASCESDCVNAEVIKSILSSSLSYKVLSSAVAHTYCGVNEIQWLLTHGGKKLTPELIADIHAKVNRLQPDDKLQLFKLIARCSLSKSFVAQFISTLDFSSHEYIEVAKILTSNDSITLDSIRILLLATKDIKTDELVSLYRRTLDRYPGNEELHQILLACKSIEEYDLLISIAKNAKESTTLKAILELNQSTAVIEAVLSNSQAHTIDPGIFVIIAENIQDVDIAKHLLQLFPGNVEIVKALQNSPISARIIPFIIESSNADLLLLSPIIQMSNDNGILHLCFNAIISVTPISDLHLDLLIGIMGKVSEQVVELFDKISDIKDEGKLFNLLMVCVQRRSLNTTLIERVLNKSKQLDLNAQLLIVDALLNTYPSNEDVLCALFNGGCVNDRLLVESSRTTKSKELLKRVIGLAGDRADIWNNLIANQHAMDVLITFADTVKHDSVIQLLIAANNPDLLIQVVKNPLSASHYAAIISNPCANNQVFKCVIDSSEDETLLLQMVDILFSRGIDQASSNLLETIARKVKPSLLVTKMDRSKFSTEELYIDILSQLNEGLTSESTTLRDLFLMLNSVSSKADKLVISLMTKLSNPHDLCEAILTGGVFSTKPSDLILTHLSSISGLTEKLQQLLKPMVMGTAAETVFNANYPDRVAAARAAAIAAFDPLESTDFNLVIAFYKKKRMEVPGEVVNKSWTLDQKKQLKEHTRSMRHKPR